MTSTRRRTRRKSSHAASPAPAAQPPAAPQALPHPEWKWRTFPVYFALTSGAFLGLWLGVAVGLAGDGRLINIAFLGVAIPFGFAISHIVVRWMRSRNYVRQRTRRK